MRDLFNPTEEHLALREMVREFTRNEVEPQAAAHDESGTLNVDLMGKVGELGLLGVTIPEEDGGAGMDAVAAVIVHHELSKSDPGFCLAYLAHSMLFVNNFYYCSNDEQRSRYLGKVLTGEWVAGMGMTEPGAGTDVLGMTTTAVLDGDEYVLNGTKTYITNGCEGFCFLVYAKVNDRITAFVVDRECPGFSTSEHIDKLGMRGSTMAELIFDDCRVPAANLLGAEGSGITHMMRNLEIERLTLAAMSVGIADRCVDIMVRHAQERKAFWKADSRVRADAAVRRRRLRHDRSGQSAGLQCRPGHRAGSPQPHRHGRGEAVRRTRGQDRGRLRHAGDGWLRLLSRVPGGAPVAGRQAPRDRRRNPGSAPEEPEPGSGASQPNLTRSAVG